MSARTRWSELHTGALTLALVAVACGALVPLVSAAERLALGIGAALALTAGLTLNAMGGLVVGVLAAAAFVEIKHRWGIWDASEFWVAAAGAGVLLVLAWLSGLLSTIIRARPDQVRARSWEPVPALESLTLVDPAIGRLRLVEEIARARCGAPAPTVLYVTTHFRAALDDRLTASVTRSVERALGSSIRPQDVLYRSAEGVLCALLVETGQAQAGQVRSTFEAIMARAEFTDRAAGGRRPVAGVAEIEIRAVSPLAEQEEAAFAGTDLAFAGPDLTLVGAA